MTVTALSTSISRAVSVELLSGKPRPFIITLYPEGTIGFREKGRRTEMLLDLRSAYLLAAQKAADTLRADKR